MNIKTFVVGGSPLDRQTVSQKLESHASISVTNRSNQGKTALDIVEQKQPDVVILLLPLVDMTPEEFITKTRQRGIGIPVVLVPDDEKGKKISLPEKDGVYFAGKSQDIPIAHGFISQVLRQIEIQPQEENPQNLQSLQNPQNLQNPYNPQEIVSSPKKKKPSSIPKIPIRVVVIGISTGGPRALSQVIPNLPYDLPAPVLVVQHIEKGFLERLAEDLNHKREAIQGTKTPPKPVKIPKNGDVCEAGGVYFAPDHFHLLYKNQRAVLSEEPKDSKFCPSVDALFASVAENYPEQCLGVVMTGMLDDGVAGARKIIEKGGICFVQDEESSSVYGMNKLVHEAGLAHSSLPLEKIAQTIVSLLKKGKIDYEE